MDILKKLIIVFFLFTFPFSSFSAPIPGALSPKLAVPQWGIYKSKFGFEILAQDTHWTQSQPPKKSRFIETVYRSPITRNNVRATLTVRVDRMKKKSSLKKYVKRWVREYPKYGYDVLGSKSFKSKGMKGYVIDLMNSKKQRQLRQVIFLNKSTAVLMTCRDHQSSFRQTLKECNQIVKAFQWNTEESDSSKRT